MTKWSLFFVMEISQHIREMLGQLFSDGELSDCFVVDIVLHGRKGITVYFDSDSGVTLEKCTRVSRFLEQDLDEMNWQEGDYVLDVSSPGIDRPLTMWRQYPRQVGRTLKVRLSDGREEEGRLQEVGMDSITLETDKARTMEIPFSEMVESFVQISF